jgi:hypothetical protein
MVGPANTERRIIMASPAHKIRIGNLSVTIWRNTSEKGNWYSATPSRSYKSGDDAWRETDSLGFDDLMTMSKLLDQAHTWIAEAMKADAKARKAREEAASNAA